MTNTNQNYRTIPLTRGLVALVDEADYGALSAFKWYAIEGYAGRKLPHPTQPGKQITILMHRQIMGCSYGDGVQVDHRDTNRLNCRRANLRCSTQAQNTRNRGADRDNRSGGLKGVTWCKRQLKFIARIGFERKYVYLGAFDSPRGSARCVLSSCNPITR